jgi:hypothetical protein
MNQSNVNWTITQGDPNTTAAYYGGASYSTGASTNGQLYKMTGGSVRCVKD